MKNHYLTDNSFIVVQQNSHNDRAYLVDLHMSEGIAIIKKTSDTQYGQQPAARIAIPSHNKNAAILTVHKCIQRELSNRSITCQK